jgi:hypothetical protein
LRQLLGAQFAALALAIACVVPSSSAALAESPADGSMDLQGVTMGVPLEVGAIRWSAESAVVAVLAAPVGLVPSDGKMHLVTANGHRLAIWCKGVGSPTVILEHGIGYGVDSSSWPTVQAGVAKETRVCRYDRAFVGHSANAKVGRSMPDLTSDLIALMAAALIPGPYILVGHSFGGLAVREFAELHPRSVAGIVRVDGSPRSAIVNLDLGSERLNRAKVLDQLEDLEEPGALGHIPLVVITRGIGLSAGWRAAQNEEAELSTSSRHVYATSSDHWIQLRQPSLVIRQILTVLHTVHRHA